MAIDTDVGLQSWFLGALLRQGDEGYEDAAAAWNLNARHRPDVVVMAECAADVRGAVRLARRAEDAASG